MREEGNSTSLLFKDNFVNKKSYRFVMENTLRMIN